MMSMAGLGVQRANEPGSRIGVAGGDEPLASAQCFSRLFRSFKLCCLSRPTVCMFQHNNNLNRGAESRSQLGYLDDNNNSNSNNANNTNNNDTHNDIK